MPREQHLMYQWGTYPNLRGFALFGHVRIPPPESGHPYRNANCLISAISGHLQSRWELAPKLLYEVGSAKLRYRACQAARELTSDIRRSELNVGC